jgi:hypothetical protein
MLSGSFRRLAVLAAAGVAVALIMPGTAGAAGSHDLEPGAVLPGTATLVAASSPASPGPTPDAYLTSDCTGTSSVYKTSTDGGRANGRGVINCVAYYYKLYDYTTLYRLRWYGWQFLDSDSSTAYSARTVTSISIWRCAGAGTYTYSSSAYHEATTVGGTRYTARTSAQNRFSC